MEFISNKYITLPLLGLGTFTMHGEKLFDVIRNALQLGYSLFDTAVKYANEEELGLALKDANNVLFQTKVHYSQLIGNRRYLRLNKKSVNRSFLLSTSRLGTVPDIYLLHSTFKDYDHYFEKLVKLREKQKTKAIGVCNISLEELQNLLKKTGLKPDIIQVEVHPYYNNKELIDFCKKQEILVEARSPLAHGDILNEWRSNDVLQRIALHYGKTVPQVILRWITQQNVVAIVRSANKEHLVENINIFDFSLTDKEIKDIDSLNKNSSFGCVSSKSNI